MSTITVPSRDGGSFQAYLAQPKAQKPAPAIVVIQEIFGVNDVMRAKCDWLASEGFMAICPDLFWRMEPGVQLTDKTDAEWARAFDFFKRFDVDQGIKDLQATAHTVRGHAACIGKVGAMGYCLGGKMAYLMATRTTIDCAVGYYGVGLDAMLPESAFIKNPLMLHIAEEDEYVNKDAQAKIKEGLKDNRRVTLHSYAGVNHAFSRQGGKHFDAKAAALADGRTLEFFRKNLVL